MNFSIVIPAYNEEKYIGPTIKSILRQDIDRGRYEIIVVDNNSHDKTGKVAEEAGADKVVIEREQGTNVARNRGYLESKNETIVFLDADSAVPSNWLLRIEQDLKNEKIMAVSGPYDYGFKGIKKLIETIYQGLVIPITPHILRLLFGKKAGVLIGGNFAVKREALKQIGGIPKVGLSEIDGLKFYWGDDARVAMLISRKVGKVIFDPKIKIISSPRRFEKGNFLRLPRLYARAYLRAYFSK